MKLLSLLATAVLLAVAAGPLHAAPAAPLLEGAGPQPTEDQARQAVIDELKRTLKDAADFKRVRFLSGPHLVTGINFADNREEAWQMCVIQGDADISRGSPDVSVKQYFLRVKNGAPRVVPAVNWKTYDSKC